MPGPGAWGPTERNGRYRVYVRPLGGAPFNRSFPTEKEALIFLRAARDEITEEREQGRTIASAIETYEDELRRRGNRKTSLSETPRRLRLFFKITDDSDGGPLVDLNAAYCAKLYEYLVKATYNKGGVERSYSVDTHRNILAESRSFLAWCVSKHWLRTNPLAAVKGEGRRRHGKRQLTIDEARRWDRAALEMAERGEAGAVAALLTVRLGLRAGEIVGRLVRDLDDDGRLLRVTEAKTYAGVRTVEVSEDLRPLLAKLAEGRDGGDKLFGLHWRDWPRQWVRRICRSAGVTLVSAHGMRGLHASLALQAGATSELVRSALGHESVSTTETSYARPEALERAKRERGMKVLRGGKR